MKVLVFLAWPEDARLKFLRQVMETFPHLAVVLARTLEEAASEIADSDVLATFGTMARDQLYRRAARLKWVHSLGTGLDNIVDAPSLPPGVYITSTPGAYAQPMSEAAILLMLALLRDFPRAQRAQQAHAWERWPSRLLHGKTVGIVGIGKISETLAPLCRAFGCFVTGFSRTERHVEGFDRIHPRAALEQAVGEVDLLVVLAPYEEDSHHLIDRRVLRGMKPDSYLVNLARGGLVDEDALMECLKQGGIAGAALDVFQEEPLPPSHPFWDLPNVIVTAHLGGFNERFVDDTVPLFLANLAAFERGQADDMSHIQRRPA